MTNGFEQGFDVWSQRGYYIIPSSPQYMSPYAIIKDPRLKNRLHYNLCGQLACIAAMGISLEEGMKAFLELPFGLNILNNNKTTHWAHLATFLKKLGATNINIKDGESIETLKGIMIALVNIDTRQGGQLMSLKDSSKPTAHWVWVKWVGVLTLYIYNPYTNASEPYSLKQFAAAHERTKGNSSRLLTIVAEEQEE